ncbi:XRE family transcriptional regulator [Mucilaginibacter panaciglaebae]|uniref:XRE family transcriptional regulator n=2 Tax=Mucilaginibacter panaciglaebae TaxID=502331 RepID=A0ABP7X056_9SPHI
MLTLAREARGLTQLELVEKVPNLNQGNYSKMEKGLLTIPTETLKNIGLILDFPLSFFDKKEPVTEPGNHYFRKRATMPRKAQTTLEARMKCIMIWVDALLEDIDIPDCKFPAIKVGDENTPAVIARKIRQHLGVSSGPIDKLVKLVERNGVIVYFISDSNDKFDGMTLFTNSGQSIIFINDQMPNDRKRFTLAHELGHLIMHLRFDLLDLPEKLIEEQANEFAGEFLLPYMDSRSDLMGLKFRELSTLKQYWKVSKAALIYTAHKRGFIDHSKYMSLQIELSRQGERKKETLDVDIDEAVIVKRAADSFINDLGYTASEIQLVLGINETDLYMTLKQNKPNNKLKLVI